MLQGKRPGLLIQCRDSRQTAPEVISMSFYCDVTVSEVQACYDNVFR
jgi:hypothetical protein